MSQPRNIVCIGAGPAAVPLIKQLTKDLPATHRLVVITSAEAYWPIAGLRAAVVPGWESKPVGKVDGIFPSSSRHVLLKGTTVTELKENSVVIDKAHAELGWEIDFEYCILATGSSYPFPCRPHPGSTVEETVTALRALQADVASSSSVLVIGGGPVGIEYAGEVAHQFGKDKQVTLVHSHDKFLYEDGWKDSFNASLLKQLEGKGVKCVMGIKVVTPVEKTGKVAGGAQEFKLSNGEVVKADFVFIAHGNSPNTGFIGAFDPKVLNSSKQVKVRPSLQLADYPHMFAVGDITDVPESKVFAHAQNHGPVASKNLLALIKAGGPSSNVTPAKTYGAGAKMIGISIGPSGGAGQFFGFVAGSWMISFAKSKTLFLSMFNGLYGL
ncbi:hypothetical protein JCM10207_006522 [Rhodosporidiobolus poonsookiae]